MNWQTRRPAYHIPVLLVRPLEVPLFFLASTSDPFSHTHKLCMHTMKQHKPLKLTAYFCHDLLICNLLCSLLQNHIFDHSSGEGRRQLLSSACSIHNMLTHLEKRATMHSLCMQLLYLYARTWTCCGLNTVIAEPCLLFFPPPLEAPLALFASSCALKILVIMQGNQSNSAYSLKNIFFTDVNKFFPVSVLYHTF